MSRTYLLGALLAVAVPALAQPVITGAANAAGYMRAGLPNGGLAQGSYIAIFGRNLGPAALAQQTTYPLQTGAFNGVGATITSGSTVTNLIITYTLAGQVGAIVPSTTPLGAGQLRLSFGGQTSAPFNVTVVARAFGLFTINQAGSGPVVGLRFLSQSNQPVSTLTEALNPGQTVTLFGTGLGAVPYPDNQLAQVGPIAGANVEVLFGGRPGTIRYVGRSSCCASIDQIVVDVPANTPPGCFTSLVVRVNGIVSNATTVSIANSGNVCSDQGGFTPEALTAAAARGNISTGTVAFLKLDNQTSAAGVTLSTKVDSLTAAFQRLNLQQLYGAESFGGVSVGSCSVYTFSGRDAQRVAVIRPTGLDAGPSIAVTNSNGNQTLERQQGEPGLYSRTITATSLPGIPGLPGLPGVGGTEYLTTGNHTATGPGGTDVGAFTTSVNWPAAFAWTNRDAITAVNRSADLTITWSGGDPQGIVSMTGFSTSGTNPDTLVGAGFICLENSSAGRFTVPSWVLQSLPPSGTLEGLSLGGLTVIGGSRPVNFTARGIDVGATTYQSGFSKTVPIN